MTTPRVHPAYSLDILVSSDQETNIGQILTAGPGHVDFRLAGHQSPGWIRMVVTTESERHLLDLESRLRQGLQLHLVHCEDRVLARSRGGKTQTRASVPLDTPEDLAIAYTPGVGRVSRLLAQSPERVNELTGKANRVAVVTDGSAVLGLGNLGPAAALPVMEGKAALFAHLAVIDAVPICLNTQDVDEIVQAITAIAPAFGGINLEDISAPRCFEIEKRLRDTLDIPVIHDDQHGTAIVVLAAMLNALESLGKALKSARIVIVGAGAAGTAVTRLLLAAGARDVTVWAPVGVLHPDNGGQLPEHKRWLAHHTNPRGIQGGLEEALNKADAVVGVSAAGVLSRGLIKRMAKRPIVFALANPHPEIDPDDIADLGAIIATGSSDYPNQVNNALAFPGLFRGLLDSSTNRPDAPAFLAAAHALADLSKPVSPTRLLPEVLDPRVAPAIATAVRQLATASLNDPRKGTAHA